jgi:uncharacterized protein YndB with AHSA1/START domain
MRERELIHRASLAAALANALPRRGIRAPAASLVAQAGLLRMLLLSKRAVLDRSLSVRSGVSTGRDMSERLTGLTVENRRKSKEAVPMPDIVLEVTIAATPDKVYRAITEQEGLSRWWTPEAAARPEVGAVAAFAFTGGPAGRFVIRMEITALEPKQKVTWAVKEGATDWADTHVTWDLMPVDDGTKVRFGHHDFASTQGSFASVAYNWAWYLASLKDYLETGTGRPGQLFTRRSAMRTYLLTHYFPRGFQSSPETATAARAWFARLGATMPEPGNPAPEPHRLGNCATDPGRQLAYTLISADNLEAAMAVAAAWPLLARGGGVEVRELMLLNANLSLA